MTTPLQPGDEEVKNSHLTSDAVVCAVPGDAWQLIETAPKDGTEILAWREDCGVMMARYTCVDDMRTTTDKDRDELDEESLFKDDWFGGDSEMGGFRLEGSEVPTHWMPLPPPPGSQAGTEGRPTNEKESASPSPPVDAQWVERAMELVRDYAEHFAGADVKSALVRYEALRTHLNTALSGETP